VFTLVQVARLNSLKDHATAARTIARLRVQLASGADAAPLANESPAVRWLIVGDGEERAALEATVREQQIGGVTHFLGTRRDVPRLLAASDVCLQSSISEGIPLTLIEAMAARLPVVATDVGGVAEVVVPEFTGLLAPAGDDATLAQHLVRLAQNRALGPRFGRNGAARAEDLFSFDRMAAGYARVFEEVLEEVAHSHGRAAAISRLQPASCAK
jgi:glycosyltransferase involved in cell wall biosynthesis